MTRAEQLRQASRRYYRKKSERFTSQGLTTRGTIRKYKLWESVGLPRLVRERIERRDMALLGFTSRNARRGQTVKCQDRNARLRLYRLARKAIQA